MPCKVRPRTHAMASSPNTVMCASLRSTRSAAPSVTARPGCADNVKMRTAIAIAGSQAARARTAEAYRSRHGPRVIRDSPAQTRAPLAWEPRDMRRILPLTVLGALAALVAPPAHAVDYRADLY